VTSYNVPWIELSLFVAYCIENLIATMRPAQQPAIENLITNESLDNQNHLLIKRQQYNLVPNSPWYLLTSSGWLVTIATTSSSQSYLFILNCFHNRRLVLTTNKRKKLQQDISSHKSVTLEASQAKIVGAIKEYVIFSENLTFSKNRFLKPVKSNGTFFFYCSYGR
jgi:hypothetical protein